MSVRHNIEVIEPQRVTVMGMEGGHVHVGAGIRWDYEKAIW